MTQIDFHVNAPGKLAYACRLARKGYASATRMVFFASDRALLERFDRELWTFSALSFIPHCHARDELASVTPILLAGLDDGGAFAHYEVLVNLDPQQPGFFSRFDRLIEIVGTDNADRDAGRARWKFYKDRGYPLASHDLATTAASTTA